MQCGTQGFRIPLFCGIQLNNLLAQSFGVWFMRCFKKRRRKRGKQDPAPYEFSCLFSMDDGGGLQNTQATQSTSSPAAEDHCMVSTTSGPRSVVGGWPGLENMAYLNEQKGNRTVIAKSERLREELSRGAH